MIRVYRAIVVCSIAVFLFQCQKEISLQNGTDQVSSNPLLGTIQGNVMDENDQPATGVVVKVGTKSATTDTRGYFRITGASLDPNASLVTAEKAGYFKAYRTFKATSGANQVALKLTKKTTAGTISASTGGEVTLSNGSKVSLPANGIVQASDGAAYSGTVTVYAAYIDPASAEIDRTIPGSLMANDKNNNRVTLASYGMLAVELESAAGAKLQIKQGVGAMLTTPIPASLQASAPATIALWYVDEKTGLWKEEGTASKNGSNYVGEVKHFSFWNCDIGIPAVTISLSLKDKGGLPLVHVPVRIKRTGATAASAYGWTDSLGQVSGLVPANEALILEVLDPCHNAIYTQNIGPFNTNTNLGVITVSTTGSAMVAIKGKLLNCSGTAVTKGHAIITIGTATRYTSVDVGGNFAISILQCPGSPGAFQIIGVDEVAQQQGTATPGSIIAPVTDAGTITACGTSSLQFINYNLDGVNHNISGASRDSALLAYTNPIAGTPLLISYMQGWDMGTSGDFIQFSFRSPATAGAYQLDSLVVKGITGAKPVLPFNVTITNFPLASGEFYEGNFSGQLKDAADVAHAINASFRIRRR